ncbi:hypothetical protein A5906_27680 [Bradyrhizobium sacchari]|uniref:Uncharacterized protein DUF4173 n=1 Tax=Bradyrhizobium sacchari TaxID=1399419 RepID=A0A560JZ80_9BRAD|nr:DUF4173 domain-containing protein [Bradyrhizobium sacchari]OPY99484.1 hypothetical protein A5906_27680 [Bradyrhizobium sacchari]TWB62667.1 uncharacterized protein DUF4173 [Bradyrhizobium sacchari]TWB76403.1 uncharacterized protein DUF4173 [Bradyrhizobium sacchari]
MTSLASTIAADIQPDKNSSIPAKLGCALALAALADWLLYGERIGLSLTLFAFAIACASVLFNQASLDLRRTGIGAAVLVAGLVPAVEELNTLSFLVLVASLTIALLLTTNPETAELADRARALRNFVLFGPFRLVPEALQIFNMSAFTRGIALWLLPVTLGTVFVALFAAANPVIEQWMSLLNPKVIFEYVSVRRVLFWITMLALVWPFIHVRWRRKTMVTATGADGPVPPPLSPPVSAEFLGPSTILRSLTLFNLLFAAQSILDGIYLWGHVALPDNMTYAAYAHRGAYPLIVTALLAAAFVLVAMRPGGPAEKSQVIRLLVYLWVGQNVLLVASSILRLDLYVGIYMLTYWRIAAFIWMGLVALGLILIVARIALNRSNQWLVCANLIALTIALYSASLVNFDAFIADYNLKHSSEMGGNGVKIDANYLLTLGPQALPAIDKVIALRGGDYCLAGRRDRLVEGQRQDLTWRAWGFRSWRLQRRLDAQAKSPPSTSPAG